MNTSFISPLTCADLSVDPCLALEQAVQRYEQLVQARAGEDVLAQLELFKDGADSFLLIENAFKAPSLPGTPEDFMTMPGNNWRPGAYAALALIKLARLIPVSYQSENDGQLIVNLVKNYGDGEGAEKSRKSMRGHTDACSFPFSHEFVSGGESPAPDFIVLIGLKNPSETPTRVAPLSKIMKALSAEAIAQLQRNDYAISSQPSFPTLRDNPRANAPVVTLHPQFGYQIRFSHSNVAPMSEENTKAKTALDELINAVGKAMTEVVLRPGSILCINNRTALHGRGEVGEQVGGQSRWVQRMYAMLPTTPVQSASRPQSFVLHP